ncbi:6490_t:CDS:1, partial [Funneliformis geosporum]
NKNNFQEIISNLLRELRGERAEINLLARIWWINLALEQSKNHQSIKLLENKIKDLEELQTNPNYPNFFIFLQIENFVDFWQKCSNENFLTTIQQFITEEFLAIGELHFFLANFGENAKKNINFFLQKILVEQEFNYLNDCNEICEQTVYFNWLKQIEEENKEILANWNQ